ncbi:MAG TPA: phosphate ABC transporter permease PtsA [Sutterella sp.]|nr:phosphate ABC transporter permease PtsA [Sutterella sp.]
MASDFSRERALRCALLRGISAGAALISALLTFSLIFFVVAQALPNLSTSIVFGRPSYIEGTIGLLPDILNTVYLIIAAVLVVLPLGIGSAVFLTEYAKKGRMVRLIEYAIETLTGIPSIIYGLVGMMVFCQFLGFRTSLLAGSMTLAIMTLPVIIRTTQESLKAVPQAYREGAFGLGAGKWRVIRTVVLPSCTDGIASGCILAVGRMLGESAALLFTAGFAHNVNGFIEGLATPGASLSVALYVYAKEQGEFEVAFVAAFILLVMSFLINFAAGYYSRRVHSKLGTP